MTTKRTIFPVLAASVIAIGLAGCANWGHSNTAANGNTAAPKSSAAAEPARGPVQTASDAAITAKVKTALGADDLVKARNINVDTVRGEVTLNGSVGSAAEKERAISLAKRVEGVTNVKDNLRTSG